MGRGGPRTAGACPRRGAIGVPTAGGRRPKEATGGSDGVKHTFVGRPQEEGMKQCSSSFPQYETKV